MENFNQIFIVEGPDCTGKTTLCLKLHEAFGYPIYHLTYYLDKDKMRALFDDIFDRMDRGEGMIIDRFLLSNMVYGAAFHDGETLEDIENILHYLGHDKSTLIIALPENREWWLELFKKSCQKREEMYLDEEGMKRVYNLFKQFYLILSHGCYIPNLVRYDYSENLTK